MREFQQKRKIRSLLYSRPALVLLFLLIVFVGSATLSWYGKYRESLTNKNNAQKELTKVTERENRLKAHLEALKTKRGLEEEIRTKYGYAKPGEQVIVVISDEKPGDGITGIRTSIIGGVWESIRSLFR